MPLLKESNKAIKKDAGVKKMYPILESYCLKMQ